MGTGNKSGRPQGTTTGQSFNNIVEEIAGATELKPEIVSSVLKAWTDIFIRNVVLYGKFYWPRCFSVNTKIRKEHKAYNVSKKQYEIVPETKILQMSVSAKIRNFWRWKIRNERNKSRGVTKDNWRSWYDNTDTKKESEK